jgi:hypothetical protein
MQRRPDRAKFHPNPKECPENGDVTEGLRPFVARCPPGRHISFRQGQIMPKTKTGKPAMAGLKPLPKGRGFDPSSLKGPGGLKAPKLVPKRGMIPGKSGQR